MSDLDFQKFSTVQSSASFGRTHIGVVGSAQTIAPESFLTIISNIGTVSTILPPVGGDHMLCIVFQSATPGGFVTGGNILPAQTITAAQHVPVFAVYDSALGKYHVGSTVDDQS